MDGASLPAFDYKALPLYRKHWEVYAARIVRVIYEGEGVEFTLEGGAVFRIPKIADGGMDIAGFSDSKTVPVPGGYLVFGENRWVGNEVLPWVSFSRVPPDVWGGDGKYVRVDAE